jgi:hypothetical protein
MALQPQMPTSTLKQLHTIAPTTLDNKKCVYCGASLNTVKATKEHIIGRRFVPKGKLHGQWNLIIAACEECNRRKAKLEDDISAVTLQADARGRYSEPDPGLADEAARKAWGSVSHRTGKLVKDSSEQLTIHAITDSGLEIQFDMTAPPQVDSSRIFELCRLQLIGLFYWVTYDAALKRGGYWLGDFFPVLEAQRLDWGNPIHRVFMDSVVAWEPRVLVTCANGFFKAAIRRHPDAACWSWALEWNHNYRIVGFFGEKNTAERLVKKCPTLGITKVAEAHNDWLAFRTEVPLAKDDDKLFYWRTD